MLDTPKYRTPAMDLDRMSDTAKNYKPTEETEATATAKTKSFAININWNILYDPGTGTEDLQKTLDPNKSSFSPSDFISKCFKDDENEATAVASAKSEAEIRNKNINILIKG
jgi:hypothetical protein